MKILLLGGSSFVGRHITEAAVAAGHDVWLANRGVTSTDTFGARGLLRIDRDSGNLAELAGRDFDAVIDVSAYVARAVIDLHQALGQVGRYVFISTISTYDPSGLIERQDEAGRLRQPVDEAGDRGRELYGELKVACEREVTRLWGDRATIIRPGIVAGPFDPTDRFTWWTRRLAEDEQFDVPDLRAVDDADANVSVIDARDLAAFTVKVVDEALEGTFDVTGEPRRLATFVEEVRRAIASSATIDWTDLQRWKSDAMPPLVLHPAWGQSGIFDRPSLAALSAGLTRRPLADTARDTRQWDLDRGTPDLTV